MDAKLLDTRPTSGEFDELLFDVNDETTCVIFEDKDYLEYLGVFGGGFGDKSSVALSKSNSIAFIISYGQGYVFSIDEREVIHKTSCDYLSQVLSSDLNECFIACSLTELYIYDRKLILSTERISADGIKLEKVDNGIVYGKVFDYSKWVEFVFDLNSMTYQCDWICDPT